jgi:hypothetical protein
MAGGYLIPPATPKKAALLLSFFPTCVLAAQMQAFVYNLYIILTAESINQHSSGQSA